MLIACFEKYLPSPPMTSGSLYLIAEGIEDALNEVLCIVLFHEHLHFLPQAAGAGFWPSKGVVGTTTEVSDMARLQGNKKIY